MKILIKFVMCKGLDLHEDRRYKRKNRLGCYSTWLKCRRCGRKMLDVIEINEVNGKVAPQTVETTTGGGKETS